MKKHVFYTALLALALFLLAPATKASALYIGQDVVAQWNDGYWYPAIVDDMYGSTVYLTWFGGGEANVPVQQVQPFNWGIGSRIQCNYMGYGTFYPATIVDGGGTVAHVRYDNGTMEQASVGMCRSTSAGAQARAQPRKSQPQYNPNARGGTAWSSSGVPDDPDDFLRAIERNKGN